MNWYIAKIIFRIHIGNGDNNAQFDESLRLIEAESMPDAFHRARSLGKKEESVFRNVHGDEVRWRFIDIAQLYPIPDIQHGLELSSETTTDPLPEQYARMIRHKASLLLQDQTILS